MLRTIPSFIWLVAALLVGLKIALLLHLNPALEWNYDEHRNGRIADNYLAGRGYVSVDPEREQLRPDAFHASFPVFVYIGWQRLGLPKHYFTLLLFALIAGTYLLGILYVQRTLLYEGLAPPHAWGGALLWALYPSVVYYIGAYGWYENIALPLLILVVYKLLRLYGGRRLTAPDAFLLAGSITLSCLLRGYLLAVYGVLLLVWMGLMVGRAAWRPAVQVGILTFALVVGGYLPVLLKNHAMFGAYIISTQAGFELLQGHNNQTQGSFMYSWSNRGEPFDTYVRAHIPHLDSLNQYQESRARGRLAMQWIAAHPAAEARLWARKTALFFSAENFSADNPDMPWNFFTALAHIAFFSSVLLTVARYRALSFRRDDLLLFAPLLTIWLMSLVFFVGFRWRYFADPIILLFPCLVLHRLRKRTALR